MRLNATGNSNEFPNLPQTNADNRSVLQSAADHKKQPLGIDFVEVSGDEKAMQEWIGAEVPLRWIPGEPALVGIGIKTVDGTIILK